MSIVEVVLGSLDEYPLLLMVEEAAGVLRIGRSLAYELARQYEMSDGYDGLPTMRVGALMRVLPQVPAAVGEFSRERTRQPS